jgi:hypothetical protein
MRSMSATRRRWSGWTTSLFFAHQSQLAVGPVSPAYGADVPQMRLRNVLGPPVVANIWPVDLVPRRVTTGLALLAATMARDWLRWVCGFDSRIVAIQSEALLCTAAMDRWLARFARGHWYPVGAYHTLRMFIAR